MYGDEERVIGRDAVEVVVVERAHGQDLDLGPVDEDSVRFGGTRRASDLARNPSTASGAVVSSTTVSTSTVNQAVSVAEADGDGNTVNDGVAADTGFAECTSRADQARPFQGREE